MRSRRRCSSRLSAPAVGVAVTLVVAACSGGGASTADGSAPAGRPATADATVDAAADAVTTSSSAPDPEPGRPDVPEAGPPAYDSTRALEACTLLDPVEIAEVFGSEVQPPQPIDPNCQWRLGPAGYGAARSFVALEVLPLSLGTLRGYGGLVAAEAGGVGGDAFFGSNKWLYFSAGGRSFALQTQDGVEWNDADRPRLEALARRVIARLDAPLPPPTLVDRPGGTIDVTRERSDDEPLRLWVGGDSIAAGPSWAVREEAPRRGAMVAETEFQVGTGLARPDFYDWAAHLAAVADARDPEVMVLFFGGNDVQPMTIDGRAVPVADPLWSETYRARVAHIMDTLAVRGRRVVWVGLPPMRSPGYSDAVAGLNEIYRSEAEARAPWVSYLSTWEAFSAPGEPGVYAAAVPGPDGQSVTVRYDDIHLNVPGSEMLATMVLDHLESEVL